MGEKRDSTRLDKYDANDYYRFRVAILVWCMGAFVDSGSRNIAALPERAISSIRTKRHRLISSKCVSLCTSRSLRAPPYLHTQFRFKSGETLPGRMQHRECRRPVFIVFSFSRLSLPRASPRIVIYFIVANNEWPSLTSSAINLYRIVEITRAFDAISK